MTWYCSGGIPGGYGIVLLNKCFTKDLGDTSLVFNPSAGFGRSFESCFNPGSNITMSGLESVVVSQSDCSHRLPNAYPQMPSCKLACEQRVVPG